MFHWVSGEVFRRRGDLERALEETRESVRILELGFGKADQSTTTNYVFALTRQGRILGERNAISLGQSEEAVAILDRAFNIADGFDPDDQNARGRLAMAGLLMADIVRDSDARQALAIYNHIFRHMAEIKDNPSFRRFEISALAGSSYALRQLGRGAEARERLDSAFERLRQVKSYPAEKIKPGSEPDVTLTALADYGNIAKAIETYERLLGQITAWGPTPDTDLGDAVALSRVYTSLAALHRRARQTGPASALEARRLELWRHWDVRLPP